MKCGGTHRYSYDIPPSPSKRIVDNNNLHMMKKRNNRLDCALKITEQTLIYLRETLEYGILRSSVPNLFLEIDQVLMQDNSLHSGGGTRKPEKETSSVNESNDFIKANDVT